MSQKISRIELENLKRQKAKYLNKQFAMNVIQEIKDKNKLDLYDPEHRNKIFDDPSTATALIKATDNVFNKLLQSRDLNQIPAFIKQINLVDSYKQERQKLGMGFP